MSNMIRNLHLNYFLSVDTQPQQHLYEINLDPISTVVLEKSVGNTTISDVKVETDVQAELCYHYTSLISFSVH